MIACCMLNRLATDLAIFLERSFLSYIRLTESQYEASMTELLATLLRGAESRDSIGSIDD